MAAAKTKRKIRRHGDQRDRHIPLAALAGFRKIFGGKIPAGAMEQIRREYRKNPGPGAFARCVKAVRAKSPGAVSPRGVCAAAGRKKYGKAKFEKMAAASRAKHRKNPVEAAADKYREFHGKDPDKILEFETVVHEHANLSGIGKLEKLVILPIDGGGEVDIFGFKGAVLAQDEKGKQLFIVGGNQGVNLEDFGINPDRAHEHETLGAVKSVSYDTEKLHLDPRDGGKAIYTHQFGGKRTRLPLMIYDVRNKLLEFSGGEYDIPEAGIRG
jgi:hypothetical protein